MAREIDWQIDEHPLRSAFYPFRKLTRNAVPVKTTKQIFASVMTVGAMASANALEIDIYGAFGMDDEPLETYMYTDGTESNLMAGEGQGIYLGHTQQIAGPVKMQVRGGIQHGFITAVDGFYRDTFTYFPVYANVMVKVSREISVVGGAFYAVNPFYKITEGDDSATLKLQSDIGFNAALRWTMTPVAADSDATLFMEVRFEHANAEYTSFTNTLGGSGDLTGLLEPIAISNLGLAIGYRF